MCNPQNRRYWESQIRQEASSQSISKGNAMLANVLGVSVPTVGTPSEKRDILIQMVQ